MGKIETHKEVTLAAKILQKNKLPHAESMFSSVTFNTEIFLFIYFCLSENVDV